MEVIDTHHAVCRVCINACGLEVTTTGGRVTQVTGDVRHPAHAGYACTKGRAQPHYLNSPDRILRLLRRGPHGWHDVSSAGAPDDILSKEPDRIRALLVTGGNPVGGWPDRRTMFPMTGYGVVQSFAQLSRGKGYTPAFLNPADLDSLGLVDGDEVVLESSSASIPAIVEADTTLRRGLISMAHSVGGSPARDADVRSIGPNTGRLIDLDLDFDRFSGQPRVSNIAVRLRLTTTLNHAGRSPAVPRGE